MNDNGWGEIPPQLNDNRLSPSRVVTLAKSAQHYKSSYIKNEFKTTKAMDEGTVIHKYFWQRNEFDEQYVVSPKKDDYPHALRTVDHLKSKCKELGISFKSNCKKDELKKILRKSDHYIQIWDDIVENHCGYREMISEDLEKRIKRIEEEINEDPDAPKLIYAENAENEKDGWFTHHTGVPLKFIIDRIIQLDDGRKAIVELKTTGYGTYNECMSQVSKMKWHIQAAMYSQAVKQIEGDKPLFCWLFVQTIPPFIIQPITADDGTLDCGDYEATKAIKLWQECKKTNRWPGPTVGIQSGALPHWYMQSFEYEQ